MFDGNAVASDGIITDLSETGARVFTRQGLTEDGTITIDLRSGGIWLFKTRGHVVWRRDDVLEPADATIGSAQGICFADLSLFARKLVRRLSSGSVIEAAALEEATQPGLAQAALTMDSDPDLKFILLSDEINGKVNGQVDTDVEVDLEPIPRLLLVAPDSEARRVLRRHLEKSEVDVVTAANTEEALICAHLAPPQLIICEMKLDGASGLELVQKVRAAPALVATPIVLLADASGEAQLDPAVGSADLCLRRPFEPEELVHRAKQLLEDGRPNHPNHPGEIGGIFGVFKNTDILQMLEANLATGVLHIDGERQGEIHMHEGRICGSFSGNLTDEAAALHLIPVRWGRFRFVSTGVRHNLQRYRSTTQLMLLALQRHDESS